MKKLFLIALLSWATLSPAQTDTASYYEPHGMDDGINFQNGPCGPPIWMGVVMIECMTAGLSYYAAKPKAYGDKVVGAMYAGGAVGALVSVPFTWFDKEAKKDKYFKREAAITTIMMTGLAYGYSRVATYNLLQSEGDSFNKRFGRNMLESNLAIIVPITAAAITSRIAYRKKKNKDVQTSLLYDGQSLGLRISF